MPLKPWMQDGKLIIDATGAPILCEECPCETCDVKERLLQRIVMAFRTYSRWWNASDVSTDFPAQSWTINLANTLSEDWDLALSIHIANSIAYRFLELPLLDDYPAAFGTAPPASGADAQTNAYCLPSFGDGGWLGSEIDTCAKLETEIRKLHSIYIVGYGDSDDGVNAAGEVQAIMAAAAGDIYEGTWNETAQEWDYAVHPFEDNNIERYGTSENGNLADTDTWASVYAELTPYAQHDLYNINVPNSVWNDYFYGYYIWDQIRTTNYDESTGEEEPGRISFVEYARSPVYTIECPMGDLGCNPVAPYSDLDWDASWLVPAACGTLLLQWGCTDIDHSSTATMVRRDFGDEWLDDCSYMKKDSVAMDGSMVQDLGASYIPVNKRGWAMPCSRPDIVAQGDLVLVSETDSGGGIWARRYNISGASYQYQYVAAARGYVTIRFADIPEEDLPLPCAAETCYPYPYPYPETS